MAQLAVVFMCGGHTLGRIIVESEPRLAFSERVGQAFSYFLLSEPNIPLTDCQITFEPTTEPVTPR